MATPTPKPNPKELAKKLAAKKIAKMKKNPANYDMKGNYGFNGMQGQTGPEAKLKGK